MNYNESAKGDWGKAQRAHLGQKLIPVFAISLTIYREPH